MAAFKHEPQKGELEVSRPCFLRGVFPQLRCPVLRPNHDFLHGVGHDMGGRREHGQNSLVRPIPEEPLSLLCHH